MKRYRKSDCKELLDLLRQRADSIASDIWVTVNDVVANVRQYGDQKLLDYTEKFDGIRPKAFEIDEAEKARLIKLVPETLKQVIDEAAENIYAFHQKQVQNSWMTDSCGKIMGQLVRPLEKVGLYVPGGTAAYPSTVLMNAIPAKVAGVKTIKIVTPPKKEGINPAVVYAAQKVGIEQIIPVGGAQAIAALAYGTESIDRVDKIVGPGNIYVATAKKIVYGAVDIDMIAGPSEVLIVADSGANPAYVAADLMSQAEHDVLASAILITDSETLADQVMAELDEQKRRLKRSDIITASLTNYGAIVVVDTMKEAIELSNTIAPEHLELAVRNPFEMLSLVTNAGSIFLGDHTPEPLGDYFAGPNHVLPTNGTARFSSALGVDSFIKKSSYLYYSEEQITKIGSKVIEFAKAEGLDAHANSIEQRVKK